ncbi:Type III pantothenate kinase [Sedimentisphaera cyanobacteriorum]|uniref:Type III pantothenate kinase n=1 Tax=Sedimentisphaera cyanobacteriorum TaxID=1940790 RepID=A0A1Q2HSP4_9BACT|nr:type III pantothenate kinase [Sedimentisphaera cyanobacteriorum]AQQ10479.1 Type III pantothenate kinase [Sedimentisphaera cyanobacteriorum]
MNILAVDIGNSNIKFGLFIDSDRQPSISVNGSDSDALCEALVQCWEKLPVASRSTEGKKEGVIVFSSVKPEWTESFRQICLEQLDEKPLEVGLGKDVDLPIKLNTEFPADTGVDRVMAAAAAYIVAQGPVVVVDIGTALTVDAVDGEGNFLGGAIAPGPQVCVRALSSETAKLPELEVQQPALPVGVNTEQAVNNGVFYMAAGFLEYSVRKFAEELGSWPQTVVTGAAAELFKDECEFVDNFVEDLVLSGIVLSYKKKIANTPES